ncbi:MAG: hypothetical protein EP340_00105 [Alphaproteobacteria bacterium]|nr:MAG: hypothetical protein EP340_00105 [Alphaproteobacteria bacterium]
MDRKPERGTQLTLTDQTTEARPAPQPGDPPQTPALLAARDYIDRGWQPIPIPLKEKRPTITGWPHLEIDESNVEQFFSGPCNVGVILGAVSEGLTDVDLDCDEAVRLAARFLPATEAIFGRASKRRSHYLYSTDLASTYDKAEIKFTDPTDNKTLLELRIGGEKAAQTVFPGSIHQTSEVIEWDAHGDPEPVSSSELVDACNHLAAAVLTARHFGEPGARNDCRMALHGLLLRHGWTIENTAQFAGLAMLAAGGEEDPAQRLSEARSTADKLNAGGHVYGFPKFAELVGDKVARRICAWLDFSVTEVEQIAPTEGQVSIRPNVFFLPDPKTIPPRQWLYDHRLIRGAVSVTLAPGGVGKSALTMAEALAMATGRDLLQTGGRSDPLRVWVWNLEDPEDELIRRFAAICLHFEIDNDDIDDRLLFNSVDDRLVITHTDRAGTTILEPIVSELVERLKQERVDVLIVDPFVSCHDGAENDNMVIDRVAKTWSRVAIKAGCAVELVHHTRKLNGGTVTTEAARGASALTNAARSVRALNQMTEAEAANAGVDNHRRYFRAVNDKANLAPPADASVWFELESVYLGNVPDGQIGLGDSVGVVKPWAWPCATDGLPPGAILTVQKALAGGSYRENAQANDWAGFEVGRVLGIATADKAGQYKVKKLIRGWVEGGVLKVVRRQHDGKSVPFLEVDEWFTN